jgi:hypothetical protein
MIWAVTIPLSKLLKRSYLSFNMYNKILPRRINCEFNHELHEFLIICFLNGHSEICVQLFSRNGATSAAIK